ncbi:kinase-like domain-containing protein [Mycena epipterygia]|nr:kinase-like domain-containing protein [Mycena epipterygia]KAJ7089163.1 kinase-like domain-containing protein [Mycena epipterygia]
MFRSTSTASQSNPDWLGTSILTARTIATEAESLPFPYVTAVFGIAVIVLESIERVKKNQEDLMGLCEDTLDIMKIVHEQILAHGEPTAVKLKSLCEELEVCLQEVIWAVKILEVGPQGFRARLRKNPKLSSTADEISRYHKRIQELRSDFMFTTEIETSLQILSLNARISGMIRNPHASAESDVVPVFTLPPNTTNDTQHHTAPPEHRGESHYMGCVHDLLASWERRGHALSAVMPPQGSPPGERLEDSEAQIGACVIHILNSPDARHEVRNLQGSDAQSCLDAIQYIRDQGSLPTAKYRGQARQLMSQLSEAQDQLPSSLFISGVNDRDEHPTFAGGFGDMYRAFSQDKMVALKRIRTFTTDSTSHRMRLEFCREVLVWQGLRHRFILPLIGIDPETFPSSFCMVSPWMKKGTVLKYLSDRGRVDVDRFLLETAQGLDYLHAQNIVHGDLRGTNILISDEDSACLSDFGLATSVSDAESTTAMLTSSTNHGGSARWFAPELIAPKAFGCERFV